MRGAAGLVRRARRDQGVAEDAEQHGAAGRSRAGVDARTGHGTRRHSTDDRSPTNNRRAASHEPAASDREKRTTTAAGLDAYASHSPAFRLAA